jgi:hypothetical protein
MTQHASHAPHRDEPSSPHRRARSLDERDHDAYRPDHKLPEDTACPKCHASIHDGRWQWLAADNGAVNVVCPACRRIRDGFPAGYVSVEGDFFNNHRVELLDLVLKHSTRATAEHPMRRLMKADDTPEGVMFTTTDTQLAREIGGALHDAYGGKVCCSFADTQELVRVHWIR